MVLTIKKKNEKCYLNFKFACKSGGETQTIFTDGWISKAHTYFITKNTEEF